jgi:hypothetical protein
VGPLRADPRQHQRISAIWIDASGGAFDTKRQQLLVWGGGASVTRNEIYSFDVATLVWTRINDPSEFSHGGELNTDADVTHPDGAPSSRHSYDYLDYLPPPVDRLYLGGGQILGGTRDPNVYLFDFDTKTWSFGPQIDASSWGAHVGVAPDGTAWQQGAGTWGYLCHVDAVANASTTHTFMSNNIYATSDVDPVRNLLIAVGNGETRVWDLGNPGQQSTVLATSGDTAIEDASGPGVAYHADTDRIVAWSGGPDVYALDYDTATWTRIPGTGSAPTSTPQVFGKWRYIASRDVFIVTTRPTENVFFYRMGAVP